MSRTTPVALLIPLMGAFQWGQISCPFFISTAGHRILSVYISTAEHRIARASLERARARAMNELLDWKLSFRFCFRVPKFVYQVKKQYSTANTVLLLPLTTKKQYHTALNPTNTKINNSTTVPLYMTSTDNSKTAVQYRMTPIYNSTLTTVQYRTFTDPLL